MSLDAGGEASKYLCVFLCASHQPTAALASSHVDMCGFRNDDTDIWLSDVLPRHRGSQSNTPTEDVASFQWESWLAPRDACAT